MQFEIVRAYDVSFAEQARVFNEAFAGYLAGWSDMDAAGFARAAMLQGADFLFSGYVRSGGELVCLGHINRIADIARLAGMGTVPSARRTGAAKYLLLHLLAEAKARGDKAMVLEVFEQNVPAVELYRRHGFRELCRLVAWRHANASDEQQPGAEEISEVSVLEAADGSSSVDYPEIPWQISRRAVVKLVSARAFRSGDVFVVIADPTTTPIQIRGLFSNTVDGTDWALLRRTLAAVMRMFPGKEFFAPAIFPEQYGNEIFGPLGFVREPLNQFLMRLDL